MKTIAINACRELAQQIYWEDRDDLWPLADRIERRWRIVGCTDALVDIHKERFRATQAKLNAELDAKYPDRLTYLHR